MFTEYKMTKKLEIFGLFFAAVSCVATVVMVKEVRCFLRLDTCLEEMLVSDVIEDETISQGVSEDVAIGNFHLKLNTDPIVVIGVNELFQRDLSRSNNFDEYLIEVISDTNILVTVQPSETLDIVLSVYDNSGVLIVEVDANLMFGDEKSTFSVQSEETYLVHVRGFAGSSGSYSIIFEDRGN